MIVTRTFYDVAIAWCAIQLLASSTNGLELPCEIPSVPLGHPTILTCHYNKSILESKEKIVVLHYRQNENENPETILFNSFFDDKMEFYTHPDYVLHNSTREIQVKIPRVTQKHVGRYVCQTLQSDIYKECKFTLRQQEVTNYDITSSTLTDVRDTSTIHVPRQNYPLTVIVGVIGAIVFTGSAIIAATIICIFFRRRCARCGHKYKYDDKPNNGVRGNIIQKQEKISLQGSGDKNDKINTDALMKPLLNLVETLRFKEKCTDIDNSLSYVADV